MGLYTYQIHGFTPSLYFPNLQNSEIPPKNLNGGAGGGGAAPLTSQVRNEVRETGSAGPRSTSPRRSGGPSQGFVELIDGASSLSMVLFPCFFVCFPDSVALRPISHRIHSASLSSVFGGSLSLQRGARENHFNH